MRFACNRTKRNSRGRLRNCRRRAAAVVEMAVVSPVLLLTTFGIIDIGQFVSMGQTVNNASREGARAAVLSDTLTVSQIEQAVSTYMCNALPGVPEDMINSALEVSVSEYYYGMYQSIDGGDMTLLDTDDPWSGRPGVAVSVTFDYANIRWAASEFFSENTEITAETVMRRD